MQVLYSRLLIWVAVIVLLLAGSLPASSAIAQEAPPADRPTPPDAVRLSNGPPGAVQDENGLWRMKAGDEPVQSADAEATGGPDDYGYVWDDSVTLNWIDATNGTDTGMGGESWNQRTGAIPLPFAFKYYDATYSSVYIGAAGYVAFQDSPNWTWRNQVRTPLPTVPNTVISPFSTPLDLATSGRSGRVFYKSGGDAPNRYFVVVWNDVRGWDSDERYTFEVVLYENGDILFQYQTMTWGEDDWYYCGYVGIEDGEGLDGLGYGAPGCVPQSIRSGNVKAIRFTRPAPTARVRLTPQGQGRFSRAGGTESFEVTVYNNGELGADTYNVTLTSPWPAAIQMGGQGLVDTNGDAIPDTGAIGQGERRKVTIQVQTPAFAAVADTNTATLNVRSTRNAAWVRSTLLRTTIASPFAQIYEDWANPGIRMIQSNPEGQVNRRVTTSMSSGEEMAVAGIPSGGYAAVWSEWLNGASNLRIAILDRNGGLQTPIQSLEQMLSGWLDYLGVAVAPNGTIGVSWHQTQYRQVDGGWEYNYNVFFATLSANGGVLLAPTNLTNNGQWGDWDTVNIPRYWNGQIVALQDGRFAVAWEQEVRTADTWEDDVFYTVRGADGQIVKPVTQFSIDATTNQHNAEMPRLAALSGNRFLLVYFTYETDGVRVAAFNNTGDRTAGPISISDDYGWPAAVSQLSNGSILLIWNAWFNGKSGFRYAILNSASLTVSSGPTDVNNPFSFTGDWAPSIAVDADNRAVVTWGEDDWSYQPTLFYALLDGNGTLLVPPTPWLAARTPTVGTASGVASSTNGYGIAPSYAFSPTSTTQTDVHISAPALSTGSPNGSAQLAIDVGNRGLPTANGVVVTAQLDPNLTFLGATPPPSEAVQAAEGDGGVYTWNVPNLRFLSQGLIIMNTGVPSATIGTRYPVTITIATSSSDVNQGNNTVVTEVMVAEQVYLPVTSRSDD